MDGPLLFMKVNDAEVAQTWCGAHWWKWDWICLKKYFLTWKKRYQNIRNTHLLSWNNKSKSMREKYETQLRPNPIEIKCNGLDQNPQQDESETFRIGATQSRHTFWTKSEFLLYVRWLNKIVHLSFSFGKWCTSLYCLLFVAAPRKRGKMALQMPFKKEQKVLKTTNASLAKLQICSYKIVFLNKKVYILGYFFELLTIYRLIILRSS